MFPAIHISIAVALILVLPISTATISAFVLYYVYKRLNSFLGHVCSICHVSVLWPESMVYYYI
jgi:hypothetical protein